MLLFRDGPLSEFLENRERLLHEYVRAQDEDYILNVHSDQFERHLVDRFSVEPLQLHVEEAAATEDEQNIPAEEFPSGFNVYRGKSYPKQVLTFHVPFSGEAALLRLRPSSFFMQLPEADVTGSELRLRVVNFRDDAEAIRSEYERWLRLIEKWIEKSRADALQFNARLGELARASLQARQQIILTRRGIASRIGVPIRRSDNPLGTYAVPKAAVRLAIPKPAAATSNFVPEPTLDPPVYREILQVMSHAGAQIETHPSLHEGKDEEALRDALLMALVPNFDSATGETFHKGGKTDILIRHEGKTLFVAECLVWNGQAHYLQKIDQALGYLTWRDSKAAIVVFSRNKNFDPILSAVRTATPQHGCFVTARGEPSEGWFDYAFHLLDDDSRAVSLAVLCFDLH